MKYLDETTIKIILVQTKTPGMPTKVVAKAKYIVTSDDLQVVRDATLEFDATKTQQINELFLTVTGLVKQVEKIKEDK